MVSSYYLNTTVRCPAVAVANSANTVKKAGNGKTISIKAMMHSLYEKYGDTIPSLYVKAAPRTWDIRAVFTQARYMSPCLLIFEDIDTIVTPSTRSYFFNEVDGLGKLQLPIFQPIIPQLTASNRKQQRHLHDSKHQPS